jgi:D-glycero-D-manno-heptose 1,7-bisphosphate phosphatase
VCSSDLPHYAHRLDQLTIIPRTGEAITLLNSMRLLVIVISNQSGVAKGYYTEQDIEVFNRAIITQLEQEGAHIDAFYYCPHHPDSAIPQYKRICECRKPKPGMLIDAGNKFDIDFSTSFLIGDKWTDIEAGRAMGCKTILVLTGHGTDEYTAKKGNADYISQDLYDAVVNNILPDLQEK